VTERHIKGHHEEKRRFGHYFNNGIKCPYMEIRCKFRHEVVEKFLNYESCMDHLYQYHHNSLENEGSKETTNEDMEENKVDGCQDTNYIVTSLETSDNFE
jgi:hypothetical protein